jgi:hypothetical protein
MQSKKKNGHETYIGCGRRVANSQECPWIHYNTGETSTMYEVLRSNGDKMEELHG